VAEEPGRVADLRGRLERLLAEAPRSPDDATVEMSLEQMERLGALGYVVPSTKAASGDLIDSLEVRGPAPPRLAKDVNLATQATGLSERHLHALAEPLYRELVGRHPTNPSFLIQHARSLAELGKHAEAAALVARTPPLKGCSEWLRDKLAETLERLGQSKGRVAVLVGAVAECAPSARLENNLAWALASVPDPAHRDGAGALQHARRAMELSGGRDPSFMDTLAAAHAEAGDMKEALAWAERALARATELGVAPELRQMLERNASLYRRGIRPGFAPEGAKRALPAAGRP
jgi:predicted Zn-dependent protease